MKPLRVGLIVLTALCAVGVIPTAKAAPAGAQEWQSREPGGGFAIVAAPSGDTIYVTGFMRLSWMWQYGTIAYDAASGARRWTALHAHPDGDPAYAFRAAITPDGTKLFVNGSAETVAYDAATGLELWTADESGEMAVSPDSARLYVSAWNGTTAYDSATGLPAWSVPKGGSIAVSGDGERIFVADGNEMFTFAISAFDRTGELVWRTDYFSTIGRIAVDPAGTRVYSLGPTPPSGIDFLTPLYTGVVARAFDATTGTQLWQTTYEGLPIGIDSGRAFVVDPSGARIYAVLQSQLSGQLNGHTVTVAYDTRSGDILWRQRYIRPGTETRPTDITTSPDGARVYVAASDDHNAYVTLAYEAAAGVERWQARIPSSSFFYGGALGIASAPDGSRVYVAGTHGVQDKPTDLLTIAYGTARCGDDRYEDGPVSAQIDRRVEPAAVAGGELVHAANCDVISSRGL